MNEPDEELTQYFKKTCEEIMETHKETFKKLKEAEDKEKIEKEVKAIYPGM